MKLLVSERSEIDEADLVRRAQAGEVDAFGELVSLHMRRAYRAARGLVGSHDDALDLSQEAFVRAFGACATIDPARPFYPWLYQIVRRLCFNHVRDARLRETRSSEAQTWLASRAPSDDPAEQSQREELRGRLARAIEWLSEIHREMIVLKELEGLRYREIAELLGIPVGTVMSRLYAARRQLTVAMEETS